MNTIALESLYILDQPAEIIAEWDDLFEQSISLEAFADDLGRPIHLMFAELKRRD